MGTAPHLLGTIESALYVKDLEAARSFWVNVMGLAEIAHAPGRHAFFRTTLTPWPQALLVFNADASARPPQPGARFPVPAHGAHGPGHVCLAVEPAAINTWRTYLEGRNIEIEADITWPNGARSIYFRDPAGNSIELADPTIWTPPASEQNT